MKNKNTGIIRRFDGLGRIVIPKEIRKALNIQEGEPIEISVSDQTILLEKYHTLNSIAEVGEAFLRAYSATCGGVCIICNTDHVVAARGLSISDRPALSSMVREYIHNQKPYVFDDTGTYDTSEPMTLFDDKKYIIEALYPIGTPDEPLGAVLLLQLRRATSLEIASAKLIATMLTELLSQK